MISVTEISLFRSLHRVNCALSWCDPW